MKVLALTSYLSDRGGGIPASMLPLYDYLCAKGVDVVLAAADAPSHSVKPNVVTFRGVGPKSFAFSWDLLRVLEREAADIVHLHGLWTYGSIAAQLWSRKTNRPVVVSTHGMVDQWALRHQALKKAVAGALYEWRNLRNAARIHALNDSESKSLRSLGFNNVVVIPNGIAIPGQLQSRQFDKRVLLFIGRLHEKKGLAETLVAWSIFQRESHIAPESWRLVIAGWDQGGYLDQLRRIAKEYAITDRVEFVGPVFGVEKHALYASADAVVLASYSEGQPMTVLEAWSHGKPTFMTDECNLPEGFAAGAAFRITREPEDIARMLVKLLPDTAKLRAAGEAARALVTSAFGWDEIGERWLSLYSSLLGSGNASDGKFVGKAASRRMATL